MRTRDWIMLAGLMMIYSGLASALESYVSEKRVEQAYNQGIIVGIKLAEENEEVMREERAIQWWTNTKDMKAARTRLCGNVYNRKGEK